MSDFPESKKSSTNPSLDVAPKPMSGSISASAQQSNSPSGQQPASASVQPNIVPVQAPQSATTVPHSQAPTQDPATQFKTENIGSWAAQQEDYFAEQNRKAEEKRKKSERTRRKVLPIVFITGGIIAVGLIIWGIVALVIALTTKPEVDAPTISGGTSEDVNNYRDILQDFFDKDVDGGGVGSGNIAAVEGAVNSTLETDEGRKYADQVRLAQLNLYINNGLYRESVAVGEDIDPNNLDPKSRFQFYNFMYLMYYALGNIEQANEYSVLASDAAGELEGAGGGY